MVPSALLYDNTLQPVVRDTWARLRGFAWGRTETPEMSLEEICKKLDMKRSTLYGHLLILKARAALQWRAVGSKTIIVSFPDADDQSRNLDKPSLLSTADKEPIEPKTKTKESAVQKSKNLDSGKVYPMAQLLADICRVKFDANKGQLLREAKLILRLDPTPTPELLHQHYNGNPNGFWRSKDWRGRKGEDPTPYAIRQTWGKWEPAKPAPAKSGELTPEQLEMREKLRAFKASQNANPV